MKHTVELLGTSPSAVEHAEMPATTIKHDTVPTTSTDNLIRRRVPRLVFWYWKYLWNLKD